MKLAYTLALVGAVSCNSPELSPVYIEKVELRLGYKAHPDYRSDSPRQKESMMQLEQAVREELIEMIEAQDLKGVFREHSAWVRKHNENLKKVGRYLNPSDPYDTSIELERVQNGRWELDLHQNFEKKFPGCSIAFGGDIIYLLEKERSMSETLQFSYCLQGQESKCPPQQVYLPRVNVNAHCGTLPGQKPNVDYSTIEDTMASQNGVTPPQIDPLEQVIVNLCTDPVKEIERWME
ncbi:hypothetical protein HYV86_02830 [Candidatus Woesearchaeota archaeon]|nr:hypothetical protein [Candidatus Woesearchaeota archaeon]